MSTSGSELPFAEVLTKANFAEKTDIRLCKKFSKLLPRLEIELTISAFLNN